VSIFPYATGGTWFHLSFESCGPSKPAEFEVDKMTALTEVVSRLVYCADQREDGEGSISAKHLKN
jgi:hypothetical protein